MNTRSRISIWSIVVLISFAFIAQHAFAQNPFGVGGFGPARTIPHGGGLLPPIGKALTSNHTPFHRPSHSSPLFGGGHNYSKHGLSGLGVFGPGFFGPGYFGQSGYYGHHGHGAYPFLGGGSWGWPGYGYGYGYPLWGGFGYGYPYYDHYAYRADRAYADAIVDAAIIGSVGNVVSSIIDSGRPVIAAPPVVVSQAPVVALPPGHYEIRKVRVGGGYYEQSKVWVPERLDPQTGVTTEGHYEVQRRWVPEVWEDQQVWVQPHP